MGLDFKELAKKSYSISEDVKKERFGELPNEIIHLLNNEVINHILCNIKTSKSEDIPARVLNSWIEKRAIIIDEQDKGKIKRFNKIHCVWLNIIEASRKFGVCLEDLEKANQKMMTSEIPNFSYLKIGIINTIINQSHILKISQDGNFEIENENEYVATLGRGNLVPHTILPLTKFIKNEFVNSNFELPFEIKDLNSDEGKMLLLFILKSGAFGYMKIYLSETDIRLIENSEALILNEDLKQAVSNWNFHKIEVLLEDEALTVINGNL